MPVGEASWTVVCGNENFGAFAIDGTSGEAPRHHELHPRHSNPHNRLEGKIEFLQSRRNPEVVPPVVRLVPALEQAVQSSQGAAASAAQGILHRRAVGKQLLRMKRTKMVKKPSGALTHRP